jgi:hypothetical protein
MLHCRNVTRVQKLVKYHTLQKFHPLAACFPI